MFNYQLRSEDGFENIFVFFEKYKLKLSSFEHEYKIYQISKPAIVSKDEEPITTQQ